MAPRVGEQGANGMEWSLLVSSARAATRSWSLEASLTVMGRFTARLATIKLLVLLAMATVTARAPSKSTARLRALWTRAMELQLAPALWVLLPTAMAVAACSLLALTSALVVDVATKLCFP